MALICAKNTKPTIKKIGKNNELPQKCTITSTNKCQDYNIIPTKTMKITSKLHYNIERKTETYSKYTILYWKHKSSEVDLGLFWASASRFWASRDQFWVPENRFLTTGSRFLGLWESIFCLWGSILDLWESIWATGNIFKASRSRIWTSGRWFWAFGSQFWTFGSRFQLCGRI